MEVESALVPTFVAEAAVVSKPDELKGKTFAFVTLRGSQQPNSGN